MRLAREEAVPALETAAEWPTVSAGAEVLLVLGRQVPLAHRVRGIPVRRGHGRKERARSRDTRVVARKARSEVDDPTHAAGVMVATGEHACTRGGAEGSGVEVRVAQAIGRQPVEVRRLDV